MFSSLTLFFDGKQLIKTSVSVFCLGKQTALNTEASSAFVENNDLISTDRWRSLKVE